jgi:hypothetical protein
MNKNKIKKLMIFTKERGLYIGIQHINSVVNQWFKGYKTISGNKGGNRSPKDEFCCQLAVAGRVGSVI